MSDSVRPHRRQPTRLRRPWHSPGKNTGVGCHFLLQCMKVKSESEVAQSCLTLCDPHGLPPTRLLHPWDFPGKSTGVGCHCLLPGRPGVMQFMGLQRVKHDWATELNWTDSLILLLFPNCLDFDIRVRCAKFGQWIFIFPWTALRIPGENAYPIREYSQAVLLISLNVSTLDSKTPINKFN